MSLDFPGAVTDYGEVGSAVVSPTLLTFSCWASFDSLSGNQTLMGVYHTSSTGNAAYLSTVGSAISIYSADGAFSGSQSSSGVLSTGEWCHVLGVVRSASNRQIYLDGTSAAAANTASRTPSVNVTGIGVYRSGASLTAGINGKLADVAVYDVALADDEIAALASGVRPSKVRPGSLVEYWPMNGADYVGKSWVSGGSDFTETGTLTQRAEMPPVTMATRAMSSLEAVAAMASPPYYSGMSLMGAGA